VNADELLKDLTARDIRLSAVDGRLRVEAPASTLKDADRQALAAHKVEVLALLTAGKDWDQSIAQRLIAEVRAARLEAFGPAEWPDKPAASRELGEHFDRIDRAWLSKDRTALEDAVRGVSELIGRLKSTASAKDAAKANRVKQEFRKN
jgi:hypothetical protein